MDQAPIDIRYAELIQWLEERYLIPKDWPKRLELIQLKKSEVFEELYKKDTTEMKKIQDSFKALRNVPLETVTFNDIQRLNQQLLKTEEAKNKTLFGNFNSKLLKDITLLIGIYNKNNMHLVESSKLIIQNISYEIPSCVKIIEYNTKNIVDAQNKINEKSIVIERNKEKLKDLCRQYDINLNIDVKSNEIALALIERLTTGDKLKTNLLQIENAIKHNQHLSRAIEVYKKFYSTISQVEMEATDPNFLHILKKFYEHGDFLIKDNTKSSDKYGAIRYKAEVYKKKYEDANIQANIEADIWKFKLIGEDTDSKQQEINDTCLLNSKSRNKLTNDLNELLIFITHRLNQLNNKDEINLALHHAGLRKFNQEVTYDDLVKSQEMLRSTLNLFSGKDLNFLLSIFEEENNIKSIVNTFELIKSENLKLQKSIEDLDQRIKTEFNMEIKENEKKVDQLKKDAKMSKKIMEKFLTDQLKRKITIMGDVNLIA